MDSSWSGSALWCELFPDEVERTAAGSEEETTDSQTKERSRVQAGRASGEPL